MSITKFEIDMLDLGAADAFLIRCFTEFALEYVVLVDAGNINDGKKIKVHIDRYYSQKYIDLAICTHPDNDHIGGFDYLLDNIKIKEFWIHDPSIHFSLKDVRNCIQMGSLQKSLRYVTETIENNINIISKIDKLDILRREPFDGLKHEILPIKVLGPTVDYYEELLKGFRDIDLLLVEESLIEKSLLDDVSFTNLSETLDEENDMSFENNSSAVFLFYPNNKKYLFTGDAGPLSLNKIVERYPNYTKSLDWLKVPHHGSKKNLSSDLVTHFSPKFAYVPGNGKRKYPSPAVVNALKKVGTSVYSTHINGSMWHCEGMNPRQSYSTADPL
jgi:beta-lactamase superfamily II metal-dependent hydrolase